MIDKEERFMREDVCVGTSIFTGATSPCTTHTSPRVYVLASTRKYTVIVLIQLLPTVVPVQVVMYRIVSLSYVQFLYLLPAIKTMLSHASQLVTVHITLPSLIQVCVRAGSVVLALSSLDT